MNYEITSTESFDKGLKGLKDRTTRNKVLARIDRIQNGAFGDFKSLGDNLFELRFFSLAGCVSTIPFAIMKWFYCYMVVTSLAKVETSKEPDK